MAASWKMLLLLSAFSGVTVYGSELPDAGRLLKENTSTSSLLPRAALPPLQKIESKQQIKTGPKVTVSGFNFVGNTLFSNTELMTLMSGSIGKEMSLGELNFAAAAITNRYREKGFFLASVFFPPQSIKPGMPVIVEVVEGILEKIEIITIPEKNRTPLRILQSYTRHVPLNKPVKDQDLTSMVLETNELPNISSRIMLEPGSKPGTTRATLEVNEGKPLSFSLDMDNYGNDATGNNRIGGTLDLYSPFHRGDQFTLHLQTSTTGDMQNIKMNYRIPVTSYSTKFGFDYNLVNYKLGGSFKALNAEGNAQDLSLSVTQGLFRQRNLILNATVAGEGRLLDDRIGSPLSRNQRHTTALQLSLSGMQMDTILEGGMTSFSFGVVAGNLGISDKEALSIDQSVTGLHTDGRYSKVNVSLSRTQNIYHGFSLYAGTYGQWTDKNLNSSEQLSLGGPGAVRALHTGEFYSDKGLVTTAELRYLFGTIGELPGRLQTFAFVDNGYSVLHNNPIPEAGTNTAIVTGAGLGIKWSDTNNSTLLASCGWKISGDNTANTGTIIFVQAEKRF